MGEGGSESDEKGREWSRGYWGMGEGEREEGGRKEVKQEK